MCTFVRGRWVSCQKSKAPTKPKSKSKMESKNATTSDKNLRPVFAEV